MSKPYTVKYRHNGKLMAMEFHADSDADAQAQINSAFYSGEVERVVARFKMPFGSM